MLSGSLGGCGGQMAASDLQSLAEEIYKWNFPPFQISQSCLNGIQLQNEESQTASIENHNQLLLQQHFVQVQNQSSSNCVERPQLVDSALISLLQVETLEPGTEATLHHLNAPDQLSTTEKRAKSWRSAINKSQKSAWIIPAARRQKGYNPQDLFMLIRLQHSVRMIL